MSSVSIYIFDVTVSCRSLIYNGKRTGPRTLHRGMPLVTLCNEDTVS